MNILHITNRTSQRGGADHYLNSLLATQKGRHRLLLAVEDVAKDVTPPCPVVRIKGLASRNRQTIEISDVIERFSPDIIHIHNVMNPEALNVLASPTTVVTVQDHRMFCPGKGKWTRQNTVCTEPMSANACEGCFEETEYFQEILALTQDRLQAITPLEITVLSQYMKKELISVGIRDDRIAVIPPFVSELPSKGPSPARDCILFVGRLVAAKGGFDALEAWRKSGLELPLIYAGTGSERRQLEAEGCQVLGWVDREQLAALYRRAAAVIMPSRWQEPFGIVGIEALALGAPVVAWDSGGISEWLPQEWVVPWGDVDGLASALRRVVGQRPQQINLINAQSCAEQLERLYVNMVNRCNG